MGASTASIVVTIIGTGIALAASIAPSLRELLRDVTDVRRDVAALRERMARIGGLCEGLTRRDAGRTSPTASI